MTTTASTAPVGDENPQEGNPNELDFEMTPEQEADYVSQVLGLSESKEEKPQETPDEEEEKPEVEPEEEKPVEKPAEKPEEKPAKEEKIEIPVEPTEIKTDDLYIEVEISREDELGDIKKETVKLVYDPEHPENFLPDGFEADSQKQLLKIWDAKAEMAQTYKERLSEFNALQEKSNETKAQQERIKSWEAEEKDLIESKVLEQEKVDDVYKFMTKTNVDRAESGLPPIISFSHAFTLYSKSVADDEATAAAAKEAEDTKKKGALIGGGNGDGVKSGDTGVYRSGSARNIYEIQIDD